MGVSEDALNLKTAASNDAQLSAQVEFLIDRNIMKENRTTK